MVEEDGDFNFVLSLWIFRHRFVLVHWPLR
jgi:hypothetical protein